MEKIVKRFIENKEKIKTFAANSNYVLKGEYDSCSIYSTYEDSKSFSNKFFLETLIKKLENKTINIGINDSFMEEIHVYMYSKPYTSLDEYTQQTITETKELPYKEPYIDNYVIPYIDKAFEVAKKGIYDGFSRVRIFFIIRLFTGDFFRFSTPDNYTMINIDVDFFIEEIF
jgi:hypothetical protein